MAVEEALKGLGLLRNKYPKPMKLGFCSRSGDVIEPMIMPQWFVDCADMARRSVEAVRDGRLKIRPEFHKKTWNAWLENIRPWCVSRQLWWGHRIPAYFATTKAEACAEALDRNAESAKHRWIVARSEADARAKAAGVLGCAPEEVHPHCADIDPTPLGFPRATLPCPRQRAADAMPQVLLAQDEDVLDTWFSSGLFPFAVMGWPDDTPDMKGFFPTSLLE